MNEKVKIYDEMCRVLTDYEEKNCDSDDLYDMLVKIQNSWEIITATENYDLSNNAVVNGTEDIITKSRKDTILGYALDWLSEHFESEELLDILHEHLDMTDDEIDFYGFDFSDLEQDNRFSVFCMKDYEDAVFFTTAIPNDLYCVASTYHYYMKSDIGRRSLDSLAGCFSDQKFIDEQVFSVLCSAMSKESRIASLIEFDFDSNQIKYCDNANGMWQTYDLQDISEAVENSNRNNDLNYSVRKNIFLKSLEGKEINSDMTESESESPSMSM